MKTLYLDCNMGAAGDMLSAALLELLPDPDAVLEELNGIGFPEVFAEAEPMEKCGIRGTHFKVTVHGEEEESHDVHEHAQVHAHPHMHTHDHELHSHPHTHDHELHSHLHGHEQEAQPHSHGESTHAHSHTSLADVEHLVRDHLKLPEKVREDVLAVYALIAEAESHAHGVPVSAVHFHEVGMLDAVMDITAVCLLMYRIAPERVICSPVHVGFGKVRCAHGILPVPVPAAAYLLQDIPVCAGNIEGELCTPTGAALIRYFADSFGSMPVMKIRSIGYGMGKKNFPAANCLRAFLGECEEIPEEVFELSCNLDDMTAEAIAFAAERLFEAGALDVYTIPVGMKKNRPGTLIRVMCREEQKAEMVSLLFLHTTTLGIRENRLGRHALERKIDMLETSFGPVRRKTAKGYGTSRSKLEYEDLARIAKSQGISLKEAEERIRKETGI